MIRRIDLIYPGESSPGFFILQGESPKMKYPWPFFLVMLLYSCASTVSTLHRKAIVVDTHNDVLSSQVLEGKNIIQNNPSGHSDIPRWRKGGVDVQFFSVWTGKTPRHAEGFYADALEEIDSLHRLILRNPGLMNFAARYHEVKRGAHKEKLVCLIGVEGGHMIEHSLAKLDSLAIRGMRYLTLTWNNSTDWASSAMDELDPASGLAHKGLSDFGKQVVRRLNELGVMVDLSHTGEQTFYDALSVTTKPVILSHSSAWSICPVFRNVKDDQIRAIAKNGGVICLNFYAGFLDSGFARRLRVAEEIWDVQQKKSDSLSAGKGWNAEEARHRFLSRVLDEYRPSLGTLVDHIDHIVKLVGDDYVGLGSDYDGVGFLPRGLEDVSTYPRITEELMKRGYSDRSIKKILGGNVLRVMKANID